MNKEEYYKRIERINNRFKIDRVSADEEYQLVCQRNYLSIKYIEHLEQQCKKQKEVIDNINQYIKDNSYKIEWGDELQDDESLTINDDLTDEEFIMGLLDILKEVSE